jgi:hypothetical protein
MGKYRKTLIAVMINYIIISILLIFLTGCNNKFDPTTTIIKTIYKNKN